MREYGGGGMVFTALGRMSRAGQGFLNIFELLELWQLNT